MKRIVILGSTGSIGTQTLDVVRSLPEEFKVVGPGAGKNWRLLLEQIKEFRPLAAALATQETLDQLMAADGYDDNNKIELAYGPAGMINLAAMPEADMVVIALTGVEGIKPTIAALNAGKEVALANKETLVAAGEIVIGLAADKNKPLRPVDSEHSAIWQCLHSQPASAIEKIILTASGGPFRNMSRGEMAAVTVEMALNHPNWSMGSKITIDSATMMNKGLEVIEAKWLFGLEYDQIEVAIHPQSIVHSAVEFIDG
ncbi:MAG: 1-deoxy-D-xylulose-5-phosphate reductoisomerase, partial [Peptococcaceae bacterium]|nr:1-deoxy-D-xylulose-5-phosphate reductoisomerase [Peptococcaceae bacterium]